MNPREITIQALILSVAILTLGTLALQVAAQVAKPVVEVVK